MQSRLNEVNHAAALWYESSNYILPLLAESLKLLSVISLSSIRGSVPAGQPMLAFSENFPGGIQLPEFTRFIQEWLNIMTKRKPELIVALDLDSGGAAGELTARLGSEVGWVKVGKQLFTREGPGLIRDLREEYGKKVFLDLKFHDIPNTAAQATRSAAAIGADMVNVHASGGLPMLRAAAEAAKESGVVLVAVTVLTSLNADDLRRTGIEADPAEQVLRLARLSVEAGVAGAVCSPQEITLLRSAINDDFLLVTPGIRPASASGDDQKRIMSPAQAARAGADYIVVGRPVTAAVDPRAAAAAVLAELHPG